MRKHLIIAVMLAGAIGFWARDVAMSANVTPDVLGTPAAPAGGAGSGGKAGPAAETILTIEDLIEAAKKNGYQSSLITQADGKIAGLKLTKLGKTEAGHGILQKKWDQKDTIDLTLGKKLDGVTIESVNRDVMVKPPIGDWIKQPADQIPAWVMVPSMVKG